VLFDILLVTNREMGSMFAESTTLNHTRHLYARSIMESDICIKQSRRVRSAEDRPLFPSATEPRYKQNPSSSFEREMEMQPPADCNDDERST
jgi:hypothetical protein